MASEGASSARRGLVDEAERAAIEASHLRSLPPEVLAELTADASRCGVPPIATFGSRGRCSMS
jgi:hypothetical protein